MKAQSEFLPSTPLILSNLTKAKLVGYRRLARHPPAAVLPVFKDESDQNTAILFYQKINDEGRIASFVGDPDLDLDLETIILCCAEHLSVGILDPAISAYELEDGNILVAPISKLRTALKDLLQKEQFARWPFSALDVARFVNDESAEELYASHCAKKLMSRSPSLAASWLSGCDLSPGARESANRIISQPGASYRSIENYEKPATTDEILDLRRPGGLEWLISANQNHESWARVWREIWFSTRPHPEARAAQKARGYSWLRNVDQNHQGWASVWFQLWNTVDENEREELFNIAQFWLEHVNGDHFRWPFVWKTLWENTKDPYQLQRLGDSASSWLGESQSGRDDWPTVWEELWNNFSRDENQRARLFTQALDWIKKGNFRRSSWVRVWQILIDANVPEADDELTALAYSWLKLSNPSKGSWFKVWETLWLRSNSGDQVDLLTRAEQWLRTSNPNLRTWVLLWQSLWVTSAPTFRQKLRFYAHDWLTSVSPHNPNWVQIWRTLWEEDEESSRNFLIERANNWLKAISPNNSQRELVTKLLSNESVD